MSFGSNLERIRKDHKISQAQLGKILGLTQQMISSYEKDMSSPNIDILIKIADYFHISLDTLVGHIPAELDETSPDHRFIRYFQELTAHDKEKCITIAQTILEDRELKQEHRKNQVY